MFRRAALILAFGVAVTGGVATAVHAAGATTTPAISHVTTDVNSAADTGTVQTGDVNVGGPDTGTASAEADTAQAGDVNSGANTGGPDTGVASAETSTEAPGN